MVCTKFGMFFLLLVLLEEPGWMINREYRDEVKVLWRNEL